MSPRELVKSPKGARESVTRPSLVEHEDMHVVSAEFQDHSEDVVEGDVARPIDPPLDTIEITDGSLVCNNDNVISSQDGILQNVVVTGIHCSARIQQDLELWRREKECDQKSAEVPLFQFILRQFMLIHLI